MPNNENRSMRQVIDYLELAASPQKQLEYEASVPIANVPSELICGFADDLFHPKSPEFTDAFTADELKDLAELYGRICISSEAFQRDGARTVSDILKVSEWRRTMTFAQQLLVRLKG